MVSILHQPPPARILRMNTLQPKPKQCGTLQPLPRSTCVPANELEGAMDAKLCRTTVKTTKLQTKRNRDREGVHESCTKVNVFTYTGLGSNCTELLRSKSASSRNALAAPPMSRHSTLPNPAQSFLAPTLKIWDLSSQCAQGTQCMAPWPMHPNSAISAFAHAPVQSPLQNCLCDRTRRDNHKAH